jgi:hypothetical protein
MSALEHTVQARVLADRPPAARRRRADDGAVTEMVRALLRDARETPVRAAHAAPEKLAGRHDARALPRLRCRPGARLRARAAAAPIA